MTILFLTNNSNTSELVDFLKEQFTVEVVSEKLTLDMVKTINPKIIISYNYSHIVTKDVIDYMDGNIINMHISYLPWNKGADPNMWSFIDDTKKGVTIHRLSERLDEGDIIYQREVDFDYDKDTLKSSYNKLHEEMQKLFKDNLDSIINNSYIAKQQDEGGSIHKHKELVPFLSSEDFSYDDTISEFLKKYKEYVI